MRPKRPKEPAFAATRRALAASLAEIDGVLPGSVVVRQMRCGKASCACRAEPPRLHGPYIQWTRTVEGKTITRYLDEEQLSRYQAWFDNTRRIQDLVAKLQAACVAAVEAEEDRGRGTDVSRTAKHGRPSKDGPRRRRRTTP